MTEKLKEIKNLIAEGSTEHAIDQLNQLINLNPEYAAEAYYLLGNAFRKKGDWQGALNNYQEAIAFVMEYVEQNDYLINCAYDSIGREEMKRFFCADFYHVVQSV